MTQNLYTEINQLPILLNATEVAAILRISRSNAYALMHSDRVRSVYVGKRVLLPKRELLKYINEKE